MKTLIISISLLALCACNTIAGRVHDADFQEADRKEVLKNKWRDFSKPVHVAGDDHITE